MASKATPAAPAPATPPPVVGTENEDGTPRELPLNVPEGTDTSYKSEDHIADAGAKSVSVAPVDPANIKTKIAAPVTQAESDPVNPTYNAGDVLAARQRLKALTSLNDIQIMQMNDEQVIARVEQLENRQKARAVDPDGTERRNHGERVAEQNHVIGGGSGYDRGKGGKKAVV